MYLRGGGGGEVCCAGAGGGLLSVAGAGVAVVWGQGEGESAGGRGGDESLAGCAICMRFHSSKLTRGGAVGGGGGEGEAGHSCLNSAQGSAGEEGGRAAARGRRGSQLSIRIARSGCNNTPVPHPIIINTPFGHRRPSTPHL